MTTKKNAAREAVKAAACPNTAASPCEGCDQNHSPLPESWHALSFLDRRLLTGRLSKRLDCEALSDAEKPCLQPAPPEVTSLAPKVAWSCNAVFGVDDPEEVIEPISGLVETMFWLAEVFTTISEEAYASNNMRLHRLAEMGAYLAQQDGFAAFNVYEDMREVVEASKKGGAA